jgi:ribonuclease HIII
MLSKVVKVDKDQIPKIKEAMIKKENVSELRPTNPYEAFRLKFGNELIVAYTSGKIVSTGEQAERVLQMAVTRTSTLGPQQIVIGSDEAGKGEWLGPMVVAAVALDPRQRVDLTSKGVMDSKLLGLGEINRLSTVIKQGCLAFKVVTISPSRFNELLMEVKDEGKSLNDLLAWGHAFVIQKVLDSLAISGSPTRVVIDEFDRIAMEDRLQRVIRNKALDVSQHPHAEEEVAVAAASILARNQREYWIDERSRRMGKNLRSLTTADALEDPFAFSFAKISFLRRGKSVEEKAMTKFLMDAITIEYMIREISETEKTDTRNRSVVDLAAELKGRNLLPETLSDNVMKVMIARNRVMHGLDVDDRTLSMSDQVVRELRRSYKRESGMKRPDSGTHPT